MSSILAFPHHHLEFVLFSNKVSSEDKQEIALSSSEEQQRKAASEQFWPRCPGTVYSTPYSTAQHTVLLSKGELGEMGYHGA